MDEWLRRIQEDLFAVGAELATPPGRTLATDPVGPVDVERLEAWIDSAEQETGTLTNFILPTGPAPSAALHVARAVSRRAEREVAALRAEEPVRPELLAYLNRLSDLLFSAARLAARRAGGSEETWSGTRTRSARKSSRPSSTGTSRSPGARTPGPC